jgi:Uncharacterized conserved protein
MDLKIPKEERKQIINRIKKYFEDEREEEIGDLSAELILSFIEKEIGPYFYNLAIKDAYTYMSESIEDIFGLEKSMR